ncbi:branched-chain amino acid ABC transporter permease [uncultured Fretibacterium sp.]|uniref:branched-chain amino acid ABC transporter permease n=1 Tax=uncultured Fretibacterium sp. TaxID=1678694 RepID=UPI002635D1A0|nr:branched-chain amino acid ABC transporter permease [uncultured Fretibacterium sp.]
MTLNIFVQHFVNALSLGSLYGLIAVGYTMVYGILRLINFAHGDIFMLGAYFVYFATIVYRLPWILGVAVAVAGTTACGLLVDRIAYRPLRRAPRISALISAIGVSFFIENFAVVVFTGMPRPVVQPPLLMKPILVGGGVRLIPLGLVVPAISFLLVALLVWVIYRTKPGLAMRAISFDIEATRMMGVSVNRIIALAFGIGSALAAVAGILWALRYPRVEPFMGMTPGIKAFIAAVLGGIGSVPGAMIGGLLLGFVEIMFVAFFPVVSGYKDAFAFLILILILLFRPTGLLGEKMEDKI